MAGVEISQPGQIANNVSPFLNQKKSWDDYEELEKSPELKRGIISELKFSKPAYIQSIAIPAIMKTNKDGNY